MTPAAPPDQIETATYETQQRMIKNSGYWYRDVIAANGFDATGG